MNEAYLIKSYYNSYSYMLRLLRKNHHVVNLIMIESYVVNQVKKKKPVTPPSSQD